MTDVVRGSCLCGSVRFEVELPFLAAIHCHCNRCQKHSGTAHETSGRARPEQIRITAGGELIGAYQPAPGAGNKAFCTRCGSSLFGGGWPDGPYISVRFGVLDDDPRIRPQYRSWVSSNAGWYEIPDDGLPRYDEQQSA